MTQSAKLPDALIKQAQVVGEENPDLSYEFIIDVLITKAEIDNGLVDDYEFES
jgi:hypothetical protein